jgi:hypothetical protein
MNHMKFTSLGFFVAILVGGTVSVQAQASLDVVGISDRGTYTDSASFRVPVVGGYTYVVLLDGNAVPVDVSYAVNKADYHELFISRTNIASLGVSNRLVRFIVNSSNRGSAGQGFPEQGLIEWTPYPTVNSTGAEFAGARLHVLAPRNYPLGLEIPLIAWVDNDQGQERRANGRVTAPGSVGDLVSCHRH